MNISVKICDWCDTCVYENEYEIIDGDIMCIMCIDEREDKNSEVSSRSVGDIQPLETQPNAK